MKKEFRKSGLGMVPYPHKNKLLKALLMQHKEKKLDTVRQMSMICWNNIQMGIDPVNALRRIGYDASFVACDTSDWTLISFKESSDKGIFKRKDGARGKIIIVLESSRKMQFWFCDDWHIGHIEIADSDFIWDNVCSNSFLRCRWKYGSGDMYAHLFK